MKNLEELINTVEILRSENGCKWDREQSHATLKKNMLEEAYEAVDAINSGDLKHLKEELGDVLLQVVLHSQIAKESGDFNIDDVAKGINEKLIRRHPHVFESASRVCSPDDGLCPTKGVKPFDGDVERSSTGAKDITVDEILTNWDRIKGEEKPHRKSVLDGISKAQSALMSAAEISKKAVKVGFEWQNVEQLWECIKSELEEFKAAKNSIEKEEEFGDILFALTNLARWYKIDPEQALIKSNEKFIKRFKKMEEITQIPLPCLTFEQWDELWNKAKTGT